MAPAGDAAVTGLVIALLAGIVIGFALGCCAAGMALAAQNAEDDQ